MTQISFTDFHRRYTFYVLLTLSVTPPLPPSLFFIPSVLLCAFCQLLGITLSVHWRIKLCLESASFISQSFLFLTKNLKIEKKTRWFGISIKWIKWEQIWVLNFWNSFTLRKSIDFANKNIKIIKTFFEQYSYLSNLFLSNTVFTFTAL